MDGKLAVIGLGSIGSMALWQASRLSDSVTGFEAHSPAHGRSAVGGDTRLFRMIYLGTPSLYPILERSRDLWAELEAETGQEILTRCGGLSIGTADGSYVSRLLHTAQLNGAAYEILSCEDLTARYPQHRLRADDVAVYDPNAGVLRTDRAVTAAIGAAEANGAAVNINTPIDSITETDDGVAITSGDSSWIFENVIVASGGWSQRLMPDYLKAHTETRRVFLSWFVARDAAQFTPEKFPIFSRMYEDRAIYGAPAVDGATVKATLDSRGTVTADPDHFSRELSEAEMAETLEAVSDFIPGLIPSIVRSDAFPELYTKDPNPLNGMAQRIKPDLLRHGLLRRRLQERHRLWPDRRARSARQASSRRPGFCSSGTVPVHDPQGIIDNRRGRRAVDRRFEWQEQRTTTPDGVYRVLRTAILDGKVSPGEQLRETHIAADLGISRSPLREALTKLEEEGLVVKVPFRGSFVVEVSARDIAEIASIRLLVEPFAAELAAPTLRDVERLRLKRTIEELYRATDTNDIPASIDAHLRFHRLFYEFSGNSALHSLWNGWENKLRLYFAADHPTYSDLHQIAVEHDKLAELALAGDIEGYRKEMLSQFHNALGAQTTDSA